MKKFFGFSIIVLAVVLGIVFRDELIQHISGTDMVRGLTSRVMGVDPPDSEVTDHGNSYYAYSTLTDTEKLVYNQIADCLLGFREEATLSTRLEEEADIAFQCLMYDHPEIFWSSAYELNMYNLSGVESEYVFRPQYNMTKEQMLDSQNQIDRYVSECMAGITQFTTEYDKAKYLYDYIILHTDYDTASPDNQNICSVFIDGRSVCMGYSKAYSYLLQKAGIESTVVAGLSEQESHAWNLVKLDGIYCYIDITWGDPAFSGGDARSDSYIDYIFFGITTEELLKTHSLDNAFPVPECTSSSNNYFMREGLYLEQFSKDTLAQMLEQHFAENSYVSIRAADEKIYAQMYHYLIEQSGIASFITGKKVSYAENTTYHTLTIFKP